MKKLSGLILVTLICSYLLSCSDLSEISYKDVADTSSVRGKSANTDLYSYYDDLAIFFDTSESRIYYILYSAPKSSQFADEIEVLGLSENQLKLSIRDIESVSIVTYSLGGKIYGVGWTEGSQALQNILDPDGDEILETPTDNPGDEIVCNCFSESAPMPSNCDHGGEGATSCSVEEATPLYTIACSVSCGTGYIACCTADANWQYEQ